MGQGQVPHQPDRDRLHPIKADATRTAALLSGEIDFVIDPSLQDLARIKQTPNLQVLEGPEYRTIFLGLDQFREELPGSDVKGKNPLKDLRVRKALYQAIDIQSIQRVVLRGLAQPTGTLIANQVNGWTKKADVRYPYDPKAAQSCWPMRATPTGLRWTLRAARAATSTTSNCARPSPRTGPRWA